MHLVGLGQVSLLEDVDHHQLCYQKFDNNLSINITTLMNMTCMWVMQIYQQENLR